jgi:hypothetical protein
MSQRQRMRLVPNSWGAQKLREANDCHLPGGTPAGGQFGAKGQCGTDIIGQVKDPTNTRTIFGADTSDEAEARVSNLTNTDAAVKIASKFGDGSDAPQLKDKVAQELGDNIEEVEGLDDFAEEVDLTVDKHNNWESLEQKYEDEYSEYQDEISTERQNDIIKDYMSRRNEAIADTEGAVSALVALHAEARAAFTANQTLADPNSVGVLPGLDVDADTLSYIGDTRPSADEVADLMVEFDMWTCDKQGERVEEDTPKSLEQARKMYDPEDYQKIVEIVGSWKELPRQFSITYALMDRSAYDPVGEEEGSKYQKFVNNLEYDSEGAMDFQSWYTEKYGDPSNYDSNYTTGQKVANFLVHKWAETSGDNDPIAIAMQYAARDEFGAQLVNTRRVSTAHEHVVASAGKLYSQHGPFMRRVLRNMYSNTQADLESLGVKKTDFVTVYRGMGIGESSDELRALPTRGAVVNVSLQPMSSFSTSQSIAHGFNSGSKIPGFIAMSVPRTQILATPRSGYGCLNEKEVVVLGGRYPAFFLRKDEHYTSNTLLVERLHDAIDRWYTQAGRKRSVLGPGDRG